MSQEKTVKVCGHTLDFYREYPKSHPKYQAAHNVEGMRYREPDEALQKGDIIYLDHHNDVGIVKILVEDKALFLPDCGASFLCPKDAPYTFDSSVEVVRFQPGDKVKVVRASTKDEDSGLYRQWQDCWVSNPMDKAIGKVFTIQSINLNKFRLNSYEEYNSTSGYNYPSFCLEKVETTQNETETKTKPKAAKRQQKTISSVVLQPNDRVRFDGVECRTAINNYNTAYFIQKNGTFHKIYIAKSILDSSLNGLFEGKIEYYNRKSKRWELIRVAP